MSTEAVLAHHLESFAVGIDAIMRDYDETSVLFTPDGPLRGAAPIRGFFEAFLRSSPPELLRAFSVVRRDIHEDTAYLLWNAVPFIPLATDTFVIRDGKIVRQSFAMLAPAPA